MLKTGRYDYAAFCSFFCYSGCSFVLPVVMVELSRSLGFPLDSGGMGAGGMLHVVRSASMLTAMLLCGFLAGRVGKRISVGAAVLLMGGGIAAAAASGSYLVLTIVILAAGFGEGILEGLATPFVQCLHPDESGRYVNISHSFWSIGTFCCVLGIGALLDRGVGWRPIVGLTGALCLIPALLLLLPSRTPYPESRAPQNGAALLRRSMEILRAPRFWLFFCCMFFAGGAEFCLTFWSASFIRLEFDPGAWAGGVGTAAIAAGMFAGRFTVGLAVGQKRLWHAVFAGALLGIPVLFMMTVLSSGMLPVLYLLLFLSGLCVGPFWPALQVYCTDRMPTLDPTLVFIYLSCAGIPGCGFFTWLMGAAGDCWGLKRAFLIEPGTLALLMILLTSERLWKPGS